MKGKIFAVFTAVMLTASANVSAKTIITINHDNTKEDIVEMSKQYPHTGFIGTKTEYAKEPVITAPYSAGTLKSSDLNDALNALKMVRYLAGVPYENISFTAERNNIAQHGAVLCAALGRISHTPSQPSDMRNSFYETGYKGCSSSNLFDGIYNLSEGILGYAYDHGQNNLSLAGHRRWIIAPGSNFFGIGYAEGKSALYVADNDIFDYDWDSYIAWPAAGDFPLQYFAASSHYHGINEVISSPWSINLGEPYEVPDKNSVVIRLTRKSDGRVWVFNRSTPDLGVFGASDSELHLAVDNSYYGINKAIVFRPDLDSLGVIKDGEVFTVELSGISYTNGKPAILSYQVRFFDLDAAVNSDKIILTIGSKPAKVFGKAMENDVAPLIVNERTMLPARFVAENLGADVYWDGGSKTVEIRNRNTKIFITIGSDTAYVNGRRVTLDSPAFVRNDRTYTPVRFIAEALGAEVEWNEADKTVSIMPR